MSCKMSFDTVAARSSAFSRRRRGDFQVSLETLYLADPVDRAIHANINFAN